MCEAWLTWIWPETNFFLFFLQNYPHSKFSFSLTISLYLLYVLFCRSWVTVIITQLARVWNVCECSELCVYSKLSNCGSNLHTFVVNSMRFESDVAHFAPLLSLWRLAGAAMACGAALRKPFCSILLHHLPLHRSLNTHRWHYVPCIQHDAQLSAAFLHLTSSRSISCWNSF